MRGCVMKRRIVLLILLVLAVGWLSYTVGCSLFPVTVEGRVDRFNEDLNMADRSGMYLNFRPGITLYDDIKDPAFWGAEFDPLDAPYFISALNSGDPSNVTFHLTNSSTGNWNVKMVMEQVGSDWYITELWLGAVLFVN
jgi:hypothetical protein